MARKRYSPPSNHTILVVDDQEEVLVSVRTLLEREGHRVLTAETGARALALFKEHEIQLVLVDYFMPRMTGEELIREIRKFEPYAQIILQTGYAGEKPARQMMAELDIQGYHDKADGPDKLLLWVDVGLKAHRLVNKLRERDRLQRELVANVSHELRTPLHIIGGYTDLLLQGHFGALPEEAEKPLRHMALATDNLAELVSDLLKYNKLEAGVAEGTQQWMPVEEVAAEMTRLAALLLDEKDVTFDLNISAAPAGLMTDTVKLRTILRNLLANAVKFTTAGSITLRIGLEGGHVCFAVSDTGTGIAPEHQELIFEPFRQLDGSSTRRYGGIGLGLALSRKLACILGGELRVESQLGAGSTFRLALPATGLEGRKDPLAAGTRAEEGADRALMSVGDAA